MTWTLCQHLPDPRTTNIGNNGNQYINLTLNNQSSLQINAQSENLKIICLNYQSIVNKKEAFWELLERHSPDIVVACETWLDQSVTDNEIIPSGYKLYRRDRDDGYGGILISVKDKIDSQIIECNISCELCGYLHS